MAQQLSFAKDIRPLFRDRDIQPSTLVRGFSLKLT